MVVLPADEYEHLLAKRPARSIFTSDLATALALEVRVVGPGDYVLALVNQSSSSAEQHVVADHLRVTCR